MFIFGNYTFFGHDSAICGQLSMKFSMEHQETIISRLVNGHEKLKLSCLLIDFDFFESVLGGK